MNGVVLYLDEIQYLNKKQQQTLLEFLENGQITLIASTTENPYFIFITLLSPEALSLSLNPSLRKKSKRLLPVV